MNIRMRRFHKFTLAWAVLALVIGSLAACGGESAEPATGTDPDPEPTVAQQQQAPAAETGSMELPDEFESSTVDGLGDVKGFYGTTFAHGTFDTRELAGQPVVVNFWFPSCPPCRAELQHFENVYQEFGPPSGGDVHFVGIQQLGIDSIEDGASLFQELGITFPGMPDNDSGIQIAYNVFSYPSTIFLDRNHNRHRIWQGAIDEENLHNIVEEIANSTTSSIDEASEEPESGDSVALEPAGSEQSSNISTTEDVALVYADTEIYAGLGDAPGFKGDTFDHGMFDLSRFEGKPVVINFWYPSCPPCRAEIPNFEHAYQTWGTPGKDAIVFVGVQSVLLDTAANGQEFLAKMGATYPAIPDVGSSIHVAYQITGAPTTFFLDKHHNVLSIHQGYIRHTQLQDALVQLIEA